MFMLLSDRQLELRRRVLRTQRGRNEMKRGGGGGGGGRGGSGGEEGCTRGDPQQGP